MQQTTIEQHADIREMLEDSTCAHLADCLYMVPDENLIAISNMIVAEMRNGAQRSTVRYKVVQDVAALVQGYSENPLYSAAFMMATEGDACTCGKCAATAKVEKVNIPNTDIRYMCNDCLKDLPGYGVVNYTL